MEQALKVCFGTDEGKAVVRLLRINAAGGMTALQETKQRRLGGRGGRVAGVG